MGCEELMEYVSCVCVWLGAAWVERGSLQCLVNSDSFISLLGGSLVVMELLTFSGSRHLAKCR